MLSMPAAPPRDSYKLWYSPSARQHTLLRSQPRSKYLLCPSNATDDTLTELLTDQYSPNNEDEFIRSLEVDEQRYAHEIESIRTFGFTFLRPPGFSKTEQALLEEQAMSESASEDNGFMENPNGELVMLDAEGGAAEDGLENGTGGIEDDEEEYDDDDVEDDATGDIDDDEEALDGWRRRQQRRRFRNTAEEEEVDLDADIPDADEMENYEDDEEEEHYEEQDLSQQLVESEADYEDDEEVTIESEHVSSPIHSRSVRVVEEEDEDDDYDMAVESD
ncbi:uncharacterized protein V2V93DRAFT_364937 [Kockiozyma suomiensis]|uniref:uncharacterized protein n=1 Tax=Kockiozyma suomiensis TaxID=1337062 RepID=UPI0033436AD3